MKTKESQETHESLHSSFNTIIQRNLYEVCELNDKLHIFTITALTVPSEVYYIFKAFDIK